MQVQTYLFGAVDVAAERVINFPQGLVGFADKTRFILASEEQAGEPVSYTLQSLDDPALAFQIIAPSTLGFSYELELCDAEEALLKSPAADDVAVMIVLYKQAEGGNIAPSLRAPLIINLKERVGLQKVLAKVNTNVTLSNLVAKV
ncbi:flagellar assembly protein FliW [Azonexus sp.]|uniref:flagellar assembly protein FliW n=1 Tax=Azonexus sp. TaxID=1872668 RepID=UPI0039E22BCA